MPRFPLLDRSDLSPEDQPLLSRPIHLFRTLAHSPGALRMMHDFGYWIRHHCELDPRLRELAIIQVGYLARSPYEYSHHIEIGFTFGLTETDMTDLLEFNQGRARPDLPDDVAAVLTAATELTLLGTVTDQTWEWLLRHLAPARAMDLLVIAAHYNSVVRVLAGLEIELEPGYQQYIDRFPFGPTRELP